MTPITFYTWSMAHSMANATIAALPGTALQLPMRSWQPGSKGHCLTPLRWSWWPIKLRAPRHGRVSVHPLVIDFSFGATVRASALWPLIHKQKHARAGQLWNRLGVLPAALLRLCGVGARCSWSSCMCCHSLSSGTSAYMSTLCLLMRRAPVHGTYPVW